MIFYILYFYLGSFEKKFLIVSYIASYRLAVTTRMTAPVDVPNVPNLNQARRVRLQKDSWMVKTPS